MPIRPQFARLMPLMIVLIIALTACRGGSSQAEATPTASGLTPTATPLSITQPTPTPPDETPLTTTLTIWWPETLAPLSRPEITELLNEQFAAFTTAEDDTVEIVFRLKRAGSETGAILPTLRTASDVAPAAMPDITLVRREELITAVQDGVIQPLEGFVSTAVIGELYDGTLELGQINGQLYGLPYTTETLMMVYRDPPEAIIADIGLRFETLLENELAFTLPGARPTGLNSTLFLQYLLAGGTLTGADGSPRVDADALLSVLAFYENAARAGLIDASVLDYTTPDAYLADFEAGNINSAVLRSDHYIQLRAETDIDYAGGSLPSVSGEPGTVLNGWMWVMVANTTQQQTVAARFIDWMMQVERQRAYAESIYRLPSQELALRTMDRRLIDTNLMNDLLSSTTIPGSEGAGGTLARAIQNAFINVITGNRTAEEAVSDVTALTTE